MLPTWRLPDGGTSGGMGILLTMFAVVTSVRAQIIISDAVYDVTLKSLSLSNSGGNITALSIKAYTSTIEPVISNLTVVAQKSVNVTSLAAIALPSSGNSKGVDLSSFKVLEPNDTCGPYFLVFTLTAAGDKDPYQQYPIAVNPNQTCTEDVDLKWVIKNDPKVDLLITVEDGKLKAEGFTMKISNTGNSDLKRRSPLNTPEVLAFITQLPYDYNATLSGAMHVGQAELRSYWYSDGSSKAISLDGWSTIFLDVPNKQSIYLAKNASINVTVTGLEIPTEVPDQYLLAVFIIDPYNKTKDSNRTNNFAVAEIQSPYTDPTQSRGSCIVVPDGKSGGRDATIISWMHGWINAYNYKANGRSGGFVPVPPYLLDKPLTNYHKVKDYYGKLDAMGLCPDDQDGDKETISNSMLKKAVKVIRNLRNSLDNVNTTQPGPAAENNKTKVLLELADTLLTQAVEEEGLVRYFLMKGLSASLKKHLFQLLMPGYGMNPMMFEMFLTEAGIPMPRRRPPPPPYYGGGFPPGSFPPGSFPPGSFPPGGYPGGGGSFGGGSGGANVWTGFGGNDGYGSGNSNEGNDHGDGDGDGETGEDFGEVKTAGTGIFSGLLSGTQNSNTGSAPSSQSATNKKMEEAACGTVYCNFGGTDMCLDESWICDAVVDCSNGKDEENCPAASPMKSDNKFNLLDLNMTESKQEHSKHAAAFHSKVAAMLKKTSPQYQGSFHSINFPGGNGYPDGGQESNSEWGGNGGGGGPAEGFFSEFDDDDNGGGMFGGKYSWGSGGGDGGRYGGGRRRLSPMKMMMMKIFARLASGASAEDLDELSFLDLDTRKLVRRVFTMAVNGDWPKVLLPLQMWTSPNGDFVGEVVEHLKQKQSVPFAITAETITLAMDFLKTNVSVRVEASLNGNQTLLDLSKLSKTYMDVIKLNAADIAALMQMKMELVMSKPQEVGLLLKTSGPEPTTKMNCMKKAQRALNLINPQDDKKEEKFFSNPFEQFMALTKQDPKAFYWIIEDGGVFRGERSVVTGTMFYDKVAVCTCDTSNWGPDGNSWPNTDGGGTDGFSNPGTDYNPGSSSTWGGSDFGSSASGGSGWGGSGGGLGSINFGVGGGSSGSFGSEGGFQSGMWGSSSMKKGESGQRKIPGSTSRRDEERWDDDDKGNHTHSRNHTHSENHTDSDGHRMKPRAQNLNPGQVDYHFSSNVREKRSLEQDKAPWANTNIQLKNNNVKTSEGLVSVEGQVVVTVNGELELSSICDDGGWGVDEAKVVCNSLLRQHMKEGHDLLSATPTSVPPNPAGPKVRISGLKCQGSESNILGCKFLLDEKCKVKEIAGVKCVIK